MYIKYWVILFTTFMISNITYAIDENLSSQLELERELDKYQQEDFPVTDTFEEEFSSDQKKDAQAITTNDINNEEMENTETIQGSYQEIVHLRVLNKITSKTVVLDAKVGQSIQFDKFRIMPILCWKSSTSNSDNKLLLEVYEKKSSDEEEKIFYSWMLSNSPSIRPFEHPIYDIAILNCSKTHIDQPVSNK